MNAIKKDVTIGDCRLILGDCLEVMPLLGKVDAVVACCDAVVYTDRHGKPAKWKPETPAGCGVNMGEPQGGDRDALRQRNNVTVAVGGALRDVTAGSGEGIEADGDQAEVAGQIRRGERAIHRRDTKHGVSQDGGEDPLQQVRHNGSVACSSCGRGSHEQRDREFGSPLLTMSHQPLQTGMVGQEKISILTDPPYGIGADNHAGKKENGWTQWKKSEWDNKRPSKEIFEAMLNVSNEQIIWGGNYFTDYLAPTMQWLVWDKGQRDFSLADFEMAWSSQQKAARIFNYARAKALRDGKQHPTQKPIELMEWCLGFLPDAQTILDPFMGSGTTLVACAKLGRKGIGIELDPEYFEMACKRVQAAYDQPDLFVAPPKQQPVQEVMEL